MARKWCSIFNGRPSLTCSARALFLGPPLMIRRLASPLRSALVQFGRVRPSPALAPAPAPAVAASDLSAVVAAHCNRLVVGGGGATRRDAKCCVSAPANSHSPATKSNNNNNDDEGELCFLAGR